MSLRAEAIDLSTTAVRGGVGPDQATGAILTPVYQSTTFAQEAVGVDKGYTYSRSGNPTVAALERALGALEDAPPAVCYSTGLGAVSALFFSLLSAGDEVICSDVVYGGTVRLLDNVLAKFGVKARFVDTSDAANVQAAISSKTKLVVIETPANPTLKLTDIEAVGRVCTEAGVPLAVDNTFLTAALQRPLELGADIVVYSTTKYIEGHNATVGGALIARDEEILEQFRFAQNTLGAAQAPWEAWLTLRGIKTLPLRLARHCESAQQVAQWLDEHPAVSCVYFPGLDSFAQRDLAERQQTGPGGMIAFELHGGTQAGIDFLNSLRLCTLAENLGAAETLVTHPASMTHATIDPARRRELGITDGLVRLSVGLENPQDIISDLEQALIKTGASDAVTANQCA